MDLHKPDVDLSHPATFIVIQALEFCERCATARGARLFPEFGEDGLPFSVRMTSGLPLYFIELVMLT